MRFLLNLNIKFAFLNDFFHSFLILLRILIPMKRKASFPTVSKIKRIFKSPKFLIDDTIILLFILFLVFLLNILSLIKNQLIIGFQNIMRKIWINIINYPKTQFSKNPKNIRQCAICLNVMKEEVSLACLHSFCGIFYKKDSFF